MRCSYGAFVTMPGYLARARKASSLAGSTAAANRTRDSGGFNVLRVVASRRGRSSWTAEMVASALGLVNGAQQAGPLHRTEIETPGFGTVHRQGPAHLGQLCCISYSLRCGAGTNGNGCPPFGRHARNQRQSMGVPSFICGVPTCEWACSLGSGSPQAGFRPSRWSRARMTARTGKARTTMSVLPTT